MHLMNVIVHHFWSVSRKTCLIYFPMCSGVTQLFSLVVLQLLDTIGPIDGLALHVWYLDDGTFVGTRDTVPRS